MASSRISLGEVLNALTLFSDNLDHFDEDISNNDSKITPMVILVEKSFAVQS